MAMTITEQNWRALRTAVSLADQLTGLMQIMTDNRATAEDVQRNLRVIRSNALAVARFCADAEKLT